MSSIPTLYGTNRLLNPSGSPSRPTRSLRMVSLAYCFHSGGMDGYSAPKDGEATGIAYTKVLCSVHGTSVFCPSLTPPPPPPYPLQKKFRLRRNPSQISPEPRANVLAIFPGLILVLTGAKKYMISITIPLCMLANHSSQENYGFLYELQAFELRAIVLLPGMRKQCSSISSGNR